MSADLLLARWTRPARVRGAADVALLGLPILLVAAAFGWRWQGGLFACGVAAAGALLVALVALRRLRGFDRRWLIARLDARRGAAEDSADLLFAPDAGLNPLQRLQRARLEARLDPGSAADLRPGWSTRRLAVAWGAAALGIAAILLWPPDRAAPPPLSPGAEGLPAVPGVPRLTGQRLRIVPPAYTGLPPFYATSLDAKAPQGARIEWTLRFAPRPARAAIAFDAGARLPLRRAGEEWTASHRLDRSVLYRVSALGAEAFRPPLHRLEAMVDTPPRITVAAPARTLTIAVPGQRRWPLVFTAADDYGVAAGARLRLTQVQGEGENITFRERTIGVRGTGPAKRRRFAPTLDLAALGFAKGDDLIAQLIVRDGRMPGPQIVRGPSLILRWPPDRPAEGAGLDGMAKTVLPAYFRSQRQIIIDAEALLKQKPRLAPDVFVTKSDAIGVDQRLLRLRYGQFLGEEAEGEPTLPTSDADTAAPADAGMGADVDVLADYGHTHDESEAATLLDPGTRATLKQALDQMWQSELHLRQGDPRRALPYAYKALTFIKQVQQATRIFLARVGPELPPIDLARRMTGKRDGLASRDLAVSARLADDPVPAAAWRALSGVPGERDIAAPLDALDRWLRSNAGRVRDPLALAAAIDAVRRAPRCERCRAALRAALWDVLARPAGGMLRRAAGDAAERRYLDALR